MPAEGMPEPLVDRMLDLEHYFREVQASLITYDIKRRDPRPIADYAREYASSLREG